MQNNYNNPHRRRAEKLANVCAWAVRWGFTTPAVIAQMYPTDLGRTRQLYENRGYLESFPIEGGGFVRGLPKRVLVPTDAARDIAYSLVPYQEPVLYRVTEDNIRNQQLRHDIIVQKHVLAILQNTPEAHLEATALEQELMGKKRHEFIPDAIIRTEQQGTIAVEMELSPKWGPRFDMLRLNYQKAVKNGEIDRIVFYFEREGALQRYSYGFREGTEVQRWVRDRKTRHLKENGKETITRETAYACQFLCITEDEAPSYVW